MILVTCMLLDTMLLVKKQIIILKLVKQKIKYLMLLIQSKKTEYDVKILEIEEKQVFNYQ